MTAPEIREKTVLYRLESFARAVLVSGAVLVAVAILVTPPSAASAQDAAPPVATPIDQPSMTLADIVAAVVDTDNAAARDADDPIRRLQSEAVRDQRSSAIHWGRRRNQYISWSQHSNRLIPVYTYGVTLDSWRDRGSAYADPARLESLYGRVPDRTYNPVALYHDQTDVYRLQQTAYDAGCTFIIVMVFDGMDWVTTRAAALVGAAAKHDRASEAIRAALKPRGRSSGLSFLDYRGATVDFGLVVTSPHAAHARYDVDAQIVRQVSDHPRGGYDVVRGGDAPWLERSDQEYLMGNDRDVPHAVTDSAASATSLFSGIKTFNGSINVAPDGSRVQPFARHLQSIDWKIGVVTSVPVSHATPGAAYANNVTRKDYQDIARDMIGLPSSSHRDDPLPGVDVLIGGGWGESRGEDATQGQNYAAGNPYIHQDDVAAVAGEKANVQPSRRYVLATRTRGRSGREVLMEAAETAADDDSRLLGLFGVRGGHLPFRTADGDFDPTFDLKGAEKYDQADITENPTLADMTAAALRVLENSYDGFWLMVEAGDVDWANHANNIDNSIGAVMSGAEAFDEITRWVERNRAWDQTAVIVTADHGHYLVIDDDKVFRGEKTTP